MKFLKKVLFLFFCYTSYCQKQYYNYDNNEIRLNIASTIAGLPELNYERVFNNNNAIGIAVAISYDKVIPYKYIVIPYYRWYFGNQKCNGFFIEANAGLSGNNKIFYKRTDETTEVIYNYTTSYGYGFAIGAKLLTKSEMVYEVNLGAGTLSGDSVGIYPRIGITIGRRF